MTGNPLLKLIYLNRGRKFLNRGSFSQIFQLLKIVLTLHQLQLILPSHMKTPLQAIYQIQQNNKLLLQVRKYLQVRIQMVDHKISFLKTQLQKEGLQELGNQFKDSSLTRLMDIMVLEIILRLW